MAKKEFDYEVTSELGVISGNENSWYKGIKTVSWDGRPAKVDIRDWNGNPDAKYKMGKGISLTDEEVDNLVYILLKNGYGVTEQIDEILANR